MKFPISAVLLAAVTLLPGGLPAQSLSVEDFAAPLRGEWAGQGEFMGRSSQMRLSLHPVLDGAFLRLVIVNRIDAEEGEWRFEGHAYYRRTGGRSAQAVWFDSAGDRADVQAEADGANLVADWQSDDGTRGRSEYRLLENGLLEVRDSVWQGEDLRPFGRAELRPVSGAGTTDQRSLPLF